MTDPAGMVARRYRVRGRVQGVGFRWYVKQVARRLGLGGHVRNLDDGSVEVVAVAPVAVLVALEAALRTGPPGAHVAKLDVADDPHAVVDTKSFHIKH